MNGAVASLEKNIHHQCRHRVMIVEDDGSLCSCQQFQLQQRHQQGGVLSCAADERTLATGVVGTWQRKPRGTPPPCLAAACASAAVAAAAAAALHAPLPLPLMATVAVGEQQAAQVWVLGVLASCRCSQRARHRMASRRKHVHPHARQQLAGVLEHWHVALAGASQRGSHVRCG